MGKIVSGWGKTGFKGARRFKHQFSISLGCQLVLTKKEVGKFSLKKFAPREKKKIHKLEKKSFFSFLPFFGRIRSLFFWSFFWESFFSLFVGCHTQLSITPFKIKMSSKIDQLFLSRSIKEARKLMRFLRISSFTKNNSGHFCRLVLIPQ